MRLAPMRFAVSIFGILLAVTSVLPLSAAEFGSRDDAIAMVRRVQEKFKKDGADATFKAINNKAFVDRDLFPWVYRLSDGTNMANALFPAVRGKHLIDLKDQDGKFIAQEWIRIATTPPYHGWSNYRWSNPVTNADDDNSAWIERMGDYLVGVGIHRFEQPNENTIGLISGSPNSDDTYLQVANDLAEVLNDEDNLRVLPIVGFGGPRNIRDVRYLKGVDIGLTQTNILNNFRRTNERTGQTESKIVYIAELFNEEVHLVARPNITSIEQLRGLRVNFDVKGSGTSRGLIQKVGPR
jgi:Cache domain